MATVLCHFVQMDKYEVPNEICKKGDQAIERYIFDKVWDDNYTPESDTRDWEIVEVDYE